MEMISDEERRKVAANLRDSAGNGEVLRDAFLEEILAGDTGLWFAEDIEIDTLLYHLADLIEPSEPEVRCVAEVKIDGERLEQLVHDAAVELTGIDREKLLALADEMDVDAGCHAYVDDYDVYGYARRIREALGVES